MRLSFFKINIAESLDKAKILLENTSTSLSNFTSSLQQQNPYQTTIPSPQESMAEKAVAASLARRSLTSAKSTSSDSAKYAGVARFGAAAQNKAQPALAPARPVPVPVQPAQAKAPAQNTLDQNLDEKRRFEFRDLMNFFTQFTQPQEAPAPARPLTNLHFIVMLIKLTGSSSPLEGEQAPWI